MAAQIFLDETKAARKLKATIYLGCPPSQDVLTGNGWPEARAHHSVRTTCCLCTVRRMNEWERRCPRVRGKGARCRHTGQAPPTLSEILQWARISDLVSPFSELSLYQRGLTRTQCCAGRPHRRCAENEGTAKGAPRTSLTSPLRKIESPRRPDPPLPHGLLERLHSLLDLCSVSAGSTWLALVPQALGTGWH